MHNTARLINRLKDGIGATRYLEIGVLFGTTFRDVAMAERIGIDPAFQFDTAAVADTHTHLFETTSDAFFAQDRSRTYDIAFIDGLHTFEQTLRDIFNVVARAHRRTVLLIDDTWPNDIYSAHPDQTEALAYRQAAGGTDRSWNGDVFKTVFFIHDFMPFLNYRTIVGSNTPQTMAWFSPDPQRAPAFNNLEAISRLGYFDIKRYQHILRPASEDDTVQLCLQELDGV